MAVVLENQKFRKSEEAVASFILFTFGNFLAGNVSRFLSHAMCLKKAQSPFVGTCYNLIIFSPMCMK